MNAFITVAILLTQLPGAETFEPRPVTVELKNGARIDGTLIEKDESFAVLQVSGGEVRIASRRILRIVERGAAAAKDPEEALPSLPGRARIELGPPGAVSFEVPEAWTETRIEGRERGFTDPTQSLFFGVSAVADAHSLWNLTGGIKKQYVKLYPGFALERERFGVLETVRSWEIEFRYEKEGRPFREIQLLLDFGDTKRIFTFTSAAARFDDLVARFRGVIDSLRPGEKAGKASPPAPDAAAAPAAPRAEEAPGSSTADGAPAEGDAAPPPGGAPEKDLRLDLEPLLPPHLRDAR